MVFQSDGVPSCRDSGPFSRRGGLSVSPDDSSFWLLGRQIQVNAAADEVMGPPYLAVLAVYSRADSARI